MLTGCGGKAGAASGISGLESGDVDVRRIAVRELTQKPTLDDQEIGALTKCIADPDVEVRRASINAIGKCGPQAASALPMLIKALQDSDSAVRIRAALAIQKIDPKNPAFMPVLIAALRAGDGHVLLDVGAMGADGAWAVPTLTELLSHNLPQVRALAAQTLGRIGPTASSAKPALQQATRDLNLAVQTAARHALEQVQTKSNSGASSSAASTSGAK
jgi:HEAT repeat protein